MNLFYTRPDHTWYPGVFPGPELIELNLNAPEYMRGLRVLFFSDVHLRKNVSDERLHALMQQFAAASPDMILMGGDYAEGSDQCLRFFKAFQSLSCPFGCYAVAGNNDFDSAATLKATMANAGVKLLRNDAHCVDLPGGRILIGGSDDHKYGTPDTKNLFPDEAGYRILLSHYPIMPECSCDLMLSGHTHAGQCNVMGITPYSVGFERGHGLLGVRGMRQIGGMHLLVGNGIGVSRFPFRLNAQPQIYLINFS